MQTLNYNYNVFILRPGYWTVGVTPSLVVVGLNHREILQLQHPGKRYQFEMFEFYSDFFCKDATVPLVTKILRMIGL
jgi:hypothetical protein